MAKVHIVVLSQGRTKEYIKGVSYRNGTYTKTKYISNAKSYQSPAHAAADIDVIAYQGQLRGESFGYV